MSPEQFCYWLQGFLEISQVQGVTPEQTQVIRDHLGLVFEKKTIDRSKLLERVPQYDRSVSTGTFCSAEKSGIGFDTVVSC